MSKQILNHERINRMTIQEAALVYANCNKVLYDPEYQKKVVAESIKLGHTKAEALEQAKNILEAIKHYYPGVVS
jgi:hypothetical protein